MNLKFVLHTKGKIIIIITYKVNKLEAKTYHTKVNLIEFKDSYYVVFNCLGDSKEPLMLLTNRNIQSKEDVISVVMSYCSRWKIEEYFRFKKAEFEFEDFRVRSINKIGSIKFYTKSCAFFTIIFPKKFVFIIFTKRC